MIEPLTTKATNMAMHYFVTTHLEWTVTDKLFDAMAWGTEQDTDFCVFSVPTPIDTTYEILNWRPSVRGTRLILDTFAARRKAEEPR